MSIGSWINSGLGPVGSLVRRVPGRVWIAVGCLLAGTLWLAQHDARVRRQAELQQVRKQASSEVATLKKQAEQNIEKANVENAKAIEKLEARRQQIEQQNRKLAAQLARLRNQAQSQAEQVATLPTSEVVTRVAAQLGLKAADVVPPAQKTPHPAAGASTLSPRGGLDHSSFAGIAKGAAFAPTANPRHRNGAVATHGGCEGAGRGARPCAPANTAALALTASGARKVETALVELNACRAESNVQSQQVSNCQARAAADAATIQRLTGSVASLNQALQAKDKILDQQANECKAELRAARGTFLGRVARVTEHLVIGVAMGVAIGVAIR